MTLRNIWKIRRINRRNHNYTNYALNLSQSMKMDTLITTGKVWTRTKNRRSFHPFQRRKQKKHGSPLTAIRKICLTSLSLIFKKFRMKVRKKMTGSIKRTNPLASSVSSSLAYLWHGRELSLLKKPLDKFLRKISKNRN
jgi:hypothetical protein